MLTSTACWAMWRGSERSASRSAAGYSTAPSTATPAASGTSVTFSRSILLLTNGLDRSVSFGYHNAHGLIRSIGGPGATGGGWLEDEPSQERQRVPFGQLLFDDLFMLLLIGVAMPFIFFTIWGLLDISSIPQLPQGR